MHLWDHRLQLLAEQLNTRIERVRSTCNPAMNNMPKAHLGRALLAYSRGFHHDPILADLLRGGVRNYWLSFRAHRDADEALKAAVADVVADLRECFDGGQLAADEQPDGYWDVWGLVDDAERWPLIKFKDLIPAVTWLFQALPDRLDHAAKSEMVRKLNLAIYGEKVERARMELLGHAEPWNGAYLVAMYARCPEAERDLRVDPEGWIAAKSIRSWMGEDNREASSFRWHDRHVDVFHAVTAFNDWAVSQLLGYQTTNLLLDRFKERVERFERIDHREAIKEEGTSGNADEKDFQNRLNRYLHDHGLDPLPEAETGNARADTVVIDKFKEVVATGRSVSVVAIEVKVVRPYDKNSTITKRLQDGVEKAVTYARRWGLGTAYLVVFWGVDRSFEVPTETTREDVRLLIKVVDLRVSPSSVTKLGGFKLSL